ncbi:MAG: ATP/GTP-binding protein [Thermofilaceae archaeon]
MTFMLFIVGPAGSGKSSFVAAFSDWLENFEIPYLTVNLDPAAEYIPYTPDIDVRDYVTARQVMEEYMLGPNGAIVASVDLMLNFIPSLREEIHEVATEGYVLIDTPGQMEIFAFRRTGTEIVKELMGDRGGVLFIVDAALATSPSAFASQIFLASSVYYRFRIPQFNVFNKIDLLSEAELEKMVNWVREPTSLLDELEKEVGGEERLVVKGLLEAVRGFLESFSIYFASAKTAQGLDSVYADLQKLYKGGEDFELPEHLRELREREPG